MVNQPKSPGKLEVVFPNGTSLKDARRRILASFPNARIVTPPTEAEDEPVAGVDEAQDSEFGLLLD